MSFIVGMKHQKLRRAVIVDAEFNIKEGRKKGELIKANFKTVLVRLKYKFRVNWDKPKDQPLFENREKIIKRHKIKHNVVITGG
jgi:hypothetical protein